jgi:hypothetical protein
MNSLELRYRRLLRLLPPAYRAVREEEMVDTFLLSMQQEDPEDDEVAQSSAHPSWSERFSVADLALRLRWGGHQAPVRYRTHGGAVRWFVAAVLLIQAVSAVPTLLGQLWRSGNVPGLAAWGDAGFRTESLWSWVLTTAGLLWIPAFVALARGHRRAAQLVGALATGPLLVVVVADTVGFLLTPSQVPWIAASWVFLLVDASVVLGLAAFHREAPPLRPRPWLISAGAAWVALGTSLVVPDVAAGVLVDGVSLWSVAVVVGALAVVAQGRRWRVGRRAEAHLGLSLLSTATFVLRATTVAIPGGWGSFPVAARVGLIVQLVVVATVAGIFGWVGARQLRRMPTVTYART